MCISVTGLRADQDAVTARLTLQWSSGSVEGHVNRIKMLKRQIYGRASPDPLRRRILGAIGVHLRAHEHRHIVTTVGYFVLATASLAISIAR